MTSSYLELWQYMYAPLFSLFSSLQISLDHLLLFRFLARAPIVRYKYTPVPGDHGPCQLECCRGRRYPTAPSSCFPVLQPNCTQRKARWSRLERLAPSRVYRTVRSCAQPGRI